MGGSEESGDRCPIKSDIGTILAELPCKAQCFVLCGFEGPDPSPLAVSWMGSVVGWSASLASWNGGDKEAAGAIETGPFKSC